jgi:hypothetical protein
MTRLPALIDEAELAAMTDTVVEWVNKIGENLTGEASRLVLRHYIREMVRSGTIPTMKVISAARDGHEDADFALRELAVEMLDRHEPLPSALAAYVQEALLRPPVTYPQGRNIADTWYRDIGIAVLVSLASERWDIPATRNRLTKRPSACSVVSLALNQTKRVPIKERQVERIYGSHSKLAEKLSASIPAFDG